MGEWNFASAELRIGEAEAILETRDSIIFNTAELGVEIPPSLEASYEGSVDNMNEAAMLADAQLEASEDVLSAKEAVLRERDFLTNIGLIGQNPDRELAEALEAFAGDEHELATVEAEQAALLIADADEVGQTRVLMAVGVLFLLLTSILVFVTYRRRRLRSAAESTHY